MSLSTRRGIAVGSMVFCVAFLAGGSAVAQTGITYYVDLNSGCGDTSPEGTRTVTTGTTITVGIGVTLIGGLGGYSITFPTWPGKVEYKIGSAAVCEGFSLSGVSSPAGTPAGGAEYRRATAVRSTNLTNPASIIVLTVQYDVLPAADGQCFDFNDEVMGNLASQSTAVKTNFVVDGQVRRAPHTLNAARLCVGSVQPPTETPTTPAVTPTDTPTVPVVVSPTDTPTTAPASPTPTETLCDNCANNVGLVLLDGFGGLHAAGSALAGGRTYRERAPYWTAPGITRDLSLDKNTVTHAMILDLFGGVHYVNWDNAKNIVDNTPFYFAPNDFAVASELSGPTGNGSYVMTKHGAIFESGQEALAHPLSNADPQFPEVNGVQYVDFELYMAGGVAAGFWALDNTGHIFVGGSAPGLSLEDRAALGENPAVRNFIDLEVVNMGEGGLVFITMQSDGTFHHNLDDMQTAQLEPLPDGTDLNDLPWFGADGMAVDFEYQTAAEGGTSRLDPNGTRPGVVLMDTFGSLHTTAGAERPALSPVFGQGFAVDVEVANFSETSFQ